MFQQLLPERRQSAEKNKIMMFVFVFMGRFLFKSQISLVPKGNLKIRKISKIEDKL